MKLDEMNTLSSVIKKLEEHGIRDLKWTGNEFQINGKLYKEEFLKIVKTFRFEGESDPDDSSILYVIRTDDGAMGYTLNAYGQDSNYNLAYDNFIRSLPVAGHNEQMLFEL